MALLPLMRRIFAIVAIVIVALMMMVLLPFLMGRHPCHCIDGVVALITMASLPLIHDSVVALIVMASLPSSSWPCSLVAMASSQSLMLRCPHHHCNGIVALITMAMLPLMRRRLCSHCNGCWVKRRYCLAGITKLGERVAKNTKLE